MSTLSELRQKATAFAQGGPQALREYPLGVAGMPVSDMFWGADPNVAAPEEFGDYLLTSNPVYSVVTQRANYLASLPLRIFRFTGESALAQIPRFFADDNETLREIYQILGKMEESRGPAANLLSRNVTAAMGALQTRDEVDRFQRQMGMEEIVDGEIFELLHRVNDFWSGTRLVRMTSLARDLWGQSYWVINRGDGTRGEPEEIWWVKPTRMRVIPHPTRYISHYEFDPIDGSSEPIIFFPWEVVRIYNANPLNEFMPLSALSSTGIYADHETSSMMANQNLHDNGLNPGAIVMPTNRLIWDDDQAKEIEDDINNRFGGVDKAHRWGVFRHEVDIHTAGITPAESQFIEGMSYDVESIARAYDWPIDLLAGKRTYENVQMAFRRAWQTIAMEAAIIASDITEFFFPMFNLEEPIIPFFDTTNVAVLQETESLKWEREKSQIHLGITVNEWREGKGLVAMEGGDELYIPANMIPLSVAAQIEAPSTVPALDDGGEEDPALLAEPNGAK